MTHGFVVFCEKSTCDMGRKGRVRLFVLLMRYGLPGMERFLVDRLKGALKTHLGVPAWASLFKPNSP
jgi:hypothetical protein